MGKSNSNMFNSSYELNILYTNIARAVCILVIEKKKNRDMYHVACNVCIYKCKNIRTIFDINSIGD